MVHKLILQMLKRLWRRVFPTPPPRPDPETHSFLSAAKGIIHVGANKGQEAALYHHYGLRVLWVEADPRLHAILTQRLTRFKNQTAVNGLVTNEDGVELTFNIANNEGQSSSIFPMALHSKIWPEVSYEKSVQMTTTTLDTIMSRQSHKAGTFDTLVLDIQGAELLVLQGGVNTLSHIQQIKTEAADFEAYQNGCTVAMLDSWLGERGFSRHSTASFAGQDGVGNYYDVVYRRPDSSSS